MQDIPLEQAIYGGQEAGGYRLQSRSPGFRDDWLPLAEQLCVGFGERPAGMRCPASVFAQPFAKGYVAVVQAADQQGTDAEGRPGVLAFRLLIVPRQAYRNLIGDPFTVAERLPPAWDSRGELPVLSWPAEPLPPRTVARLQTILQREDGPVLLGGVQVLVDGGRLVFERPGPDAPLLRDLWSLLPTSTRGELWPASFVFGNALEFDAVVVPRVGDAFPGYVNEQQAEYYPDGRYELRLQTAVEAGDQEEVDRLFARRSRGQTWRLGFFILALFIVAVLFEQFLTPPRPFPPPMAPEPPPTRLELPPAADFPALTPAESRQLADDLRLLARQLGLDLPATASPETLLEALDHKLGIPDHRRDPGDELLQGPVQRRLRALLWKHGIEDYRDARLSCGELIEKLRQRLIQKKIIGKEHDG